MLASSVSRDMTAIDERKMGLKGPETDNDAPFAASDVQHDAVSMSATVGISLM
jgi:hypothetical protein